MTQPYAAIISPNNPAEANTAKVIYILYLVGLVVGVTQLVGLIMAYVYRSDAPLWVQTHYQMQIRSFWIGVLYIVICWFLMWVFVGYFAVLLVFVWWIVRCAIGLKTSTNGFPYPNPTSWLW